MFSDVARFMSCLTISKIVYVKSAGPNGVRGKCERSVHISRIRQCVSHGWSKFSMGSFLVAFLVVLASDLPSIRILPPK